MLVIATALRRAGQQRGCRASHAGIAMAEIVLDGAEIRGLVGHVVAAGMAERMQVDIQEPSTLSRL